MIKLRKNGLVLLALVAGPAGAADLPATPAYKAPVAVAADTGGLYLWIDGSYQTIRLPTYNLGPATNVGMFPPLGSGVYGSQIINVDPRLNGAGVSGTVGYVLPRGTFWAFGSNFRLELGASYVRATGTDSGAATYTLSPGGTYQLLNGGFMVSYGCVGICNSTSSVTTTYDSWQYDLKAAGDFKSGSLTWTPSLALFGGSSRNNQVLNNLTNNGFSPTLNDIYTANTTLQWRDLGARAGLDGTVDVTSSLAFGLGGFVGIADRHTDLTGSDSFSFSVGTFSGASAIAAGADQAALVANAQAKLTFRPMPNVSLVTFAGLNFDNSVPRIAAPRFIGPFNFADPTIPASILRVAETSYYVGGGLKIKFGP
jgi:hypothetical protein